MAKIRWAILGTGRIAAALAKAIKASTTGELLAVASRAQESAERFGDEFDIPRRYALYEKALEDREVEAVYISLPNHLHALWTIRCAEAGKHILCEKPFGSNFPEAMAALEAVRDHDVFLMEAFMYRCHPQTAKIVELVRSGVIGEVRLIQANFSFNFGVQPHNIRSQAAMSGGGIMDVGCYCMSLARLVAGAALGLPGPAEPTEVKGVAHIDPQGGVDMWATASVKFPGDIAAALSCGMQVAVPAPAAIYGSKGRIIIHNPWFPGETPEATRIEVYAEGEKEPRCENAPGAAGLYTIEVDTVARHLAERQPRPPAMTWDDTLGNMKALDEWRRSAGVVFACEKPEGLRVPINGRMLRPRSDAMPSGKIAGVDKPVSRLILGTMRHVVGDLPKTFAMLDRYVECGGNALDLAWAYGTEVQVGEWLKQRGIRESMVLIGKAAAPAQCTPAMASEQLLQSLERLQTPYLDLFLLHRDNPSIPVGEFVDCLNEHVSVGRIRAFGGSNWSWQRLEEANAYARRAGKIGFAASSPNFSLAVWNEPMWSDCLQAVDRASREWYSKTQMPLLAWSSQANGFFSGRFKPEDRDEPALQNIVRVWYNDDNFRRLARAQELAARLKATPLQIALAYVLCQPLDIYAMIGPQTMAEMSESLGALRLRLSAADLAWLNLEA